jgi:microcystin-dependent protein
MNTSYNVAPNITDNFPATNPIGSMLLWATSVAPANYLICDGTAVSRTLYNVLFSVLGTTWGSGDGSTTFNVPNTAGRVIRGVDGTYTQASTGGADAFTLAANQLPNHGHTINDPQHFHNTVQRGVGFAAASGDNGNRCDFGGTTESSFTGITVADSLLVGGSQQTQVTTRVVNSYIAINYIIRAT